MDLAVLKKQDIRWYQILFLSLFLCFAMFTLDWDITWKQIGFNLGLALLTQLFFIFWLKLPDYHSLKSAFISGLGICLLLKSSSPNIYALAIIIAISSKFLIQFKKKHLFNPVNLGIVLVVFFTKDAWISPGQWGATSGFIFLFGVGGMFILYNIKRLETAAGFLGTLFIAEWIYKILYLGWELDHLMHDFINGTLLLFSFFMITDPRTIPASPKARWTWSIAIALICFYLKNWHYQTDAPLKVLLCMTPLVPILDIIFKQQFFKWNSYEKSSN